MRQPPPSRFARFGAFELDLRSLDLRRGGEGVDLQLQPKKILAYLIQHPRRTVLRSELQDHLWGDRHVDATQGLNNAVRQIRKSLGDPAKKPLFLETVPRAGYRFIAPVEIVEAAAPSPEKAPLRGWRGWPGVAVVAVLVLLAALVTQWRGRDPMPEDRSVRVAILPLENLSGPAAEPLSALFSEEILTALSGLDTRRLTVLSRASMQRYSTHPQQLRKVAEELGADLLVEGSVRQDPQGTVLLVRLFRADVESILWGQRFAFDQAQVGSGAAVVAGEIARALSAHALAVPLQVPRVTTLGLANPEAWALFVEARFRLSAGTAADLEAARQAFRRVTVLEPHHAPAWLGLAQATWGLPCDDPQVREEAQSLSEKALALDPLSGQAHLLRARIAFLQEWDLERAQGHFQRALELADGLSEAHSAYGLFLAIRGQAPAAIREADRALELDPISGLGHYDAGLTYLMSRQYREAAALCRSALEQLESTSEPLRWCLLDALVGLEEYEEARNLVLVWLRERPDRGPVERAVVAAPSPRQAVGIFLTAMAASNGPTDYGSDFVGWRALKAARAGEKDKALDWLEAAHRQRSCSFFWASSPAWDPWREEPRFQALVADSPLAPPNLATGL